MPVERSSARSATNKVHRKVKVAIRESKGCSDGVRTQELKKKGSKRVQSRGNDNGDVSYVNGKLSKISGRGKMDMKLKSGNEGKLSKTSSMGKMDMKLKSGNEGKLSKTSSRGKMDMKFKSGNEGKLSKISSRGKRDMKLKSGNEGREMVIHGNSGCKRKRIYVDPGMAVDRTYGCNVTKHDGKSMSKVEKGVARSFSNKEKNLPQGKGCDLGDQRNLRGKIKSADAVDNAQKNSLENRTLKTGDRRKAPMVKKTYQNQRKHAVDSVETPHTKRVSGKKSLATDSELMEDLPKKKKKRVIRIDPNDISNKRLDDDAANSGNSKEQKDLAEKADVEMSKNAKFRAIRPSSSILSFVEDNLLGRRRDIEFRRAGYNTELSAPLDSIPFSTSSERERIEVPVFRNKLEFFAAAKISSSFPSPDLPEIAFAGRSNVGKSSLLNALTRQWGVVRTSDKPGLTQTINFFKLGPKLSLVDLPGYGFAYAKEEVKEAWEELVKEYVTSRVSLKRVCLLIDTKWGMKPRDHELIDLMERSQTKYQIVLTKTDLVFPITVARRAMEIEESLKAKKSAIQPMMMVSSRTGAGIRSLRTVLAGIARFVKR